MNTINNLQINYFTFEQGDSKVLMNCEIKKEKSIFHISQTDLNKIINKLNLLGINVMDFCKKYNIENKGAIYDINLSNIESSKRMIKRITFSKNFLRIKK